MKTIVFSAPVLAQPGALDSSFGSGGIALVPVPNGPGGGAAKVLEQSNAEILVASDSGNVALLQSNGALDTSFGSQGIVTVTASNGQALVIVDMQVQSNGQILVLGDISQPSCTDCAHPKLFTHGLVERLNANGSVDTSFGSSGEIPLTVLGSGSSDSPSALLLQSNGFILVADTPASASSAEVLRFNTSGAVDATFGSNGAAKVSNTENIVALGLQSDNKIVVIGAGQSASRLLSNGAADTSTASGTVTATTGYGAAIQSNDDYIQVLPPAQMPSASFQFGPLHARQYH